MPKPKVSQSMSIAVWPLLRSTLLLLLWLLFSGSETLQKEFDCLTCMGRLCTCLEAVGRLGWLKQQLTCDEKQEQGHCTSMVPW
jgi:hypothetical protein